MAKYRHSKRPVVEYIDGNGNRSTTRPSDWPDLLSTSSLPIAKSDHGLTNISATLESNHQKPIAQKVDPIGQLNKVGPAPQPGAKNRIRFTKSRKPPTRPGSKPDGTKATVQYFIGIRKCYAEWLRKRAALRAMARSQMILGNGLGQWSLPADVPDVESAGQGWTTITLSLDGSDWDRLCLNAVTATWPADNPAPADPDPVTYCVLASLGIVKLAVPGPVLFTVTERQVLADLNHALCRAEQWNPWALPLPPIFPLSLAISDLERRLRKNGFFNGDEVFATKIAELVVEIEAKEIAGHPADAEWNRMVQLANKIGNKYATTEL